jgi:hypothetical protein
VEGTQAMGKTKDIRAAPAVYDVYDRLAVTG